MSNPPVARAGGFGVPVKNFEQPGNTGSIASTLPTLTAAVVGAATTLPNFSGPIASTLPTLSSGGGEVLLDDLGELLVDDLGNTLTGEDAAGFTGIVGPATSTGTIATRLPTLTAALAGTNYLLFAGGAEASTLPTLTAALTGFHTITGAVAATLPSIATRNNVLLDDLGNLILDDLGNPILVDGSVTFFGFVGNPMTATMASTLPTVTDGLIGLHTAAGAIGGLLASTLPTLTDALAGAVSPRGAVASSLNAVTAALAGTETLTGTAASTLPTLTDALAGTALSPLSGTIASTLPILSAALVGQHTTPAPPPPAAGRGDDYPWAVYKKAAEREKKARARTQALRKQIRQKLGLDPPDPEPVDDSPRQADPLGPFYLQPDLGVLGLQSQLGLAEGELSAATKALRQADDEVALNAILAGDDAAPQTDPLPAQPEPPPIEDNPPMVIMGKDLLQHFGGIHQGMTDTADRQSQSLEMQAQIAQGLAATTAQHGQAIQQMAEAIAKLTETQDQLMKAVKAPRNKKLTVTRNAKGAITGADVLED